MDPYSQGEVQNYPHGIGEEEEHHEKKPVLKKVKDKVKKIKNTISKKAHGHEQEHENGHEHDYVSEEEEGYEEDEDDKVVDPEIHGAPMYDSSAATAILARGRDENIEPTRVGLGTTPIGRVEEDYPAPNSRSTQSPPSDYTNLVSPPTIGQIEEDSAAPNSRSKPSAPSDYTHPVSPPSEVYESTASTEKPVEGHDENIEPEKMSLGNIIGSAEEDPAAPNTKQTTSAPSDYTKLSSSTGNDVVGESPIIGSFEAMAIADESKGEKEVPQSTPPTGTHDQFSPEKEPQNEEKGTSYTEKISSTATAAREAAASAASTVYNKVSGAGTAVIGKVQAQGGATGPEPSGGTSVKEFFVQKLSPGDEDRALSEVISDAIHTKKQEASDSHPPPPETETETSGGKGMVDKIKGAVTSFIGAGRVSGNEASQGIGVPAREGVVEESGQQVESKEEEHDIKHGG